jgi:hypothetical protein
MAIMPPGGNKMVQVKASKARQKLNVDKDEDAKRYAAMEAKKKHADKPIRVPWYGQKEDSKRSFDAGQNPE